MTPTALIKELTPTLMANLIGESDGRSSRGGKAPLSSYPASRGGRFLG